MLLLNNNFIVLYRYCYLFSEMLIKLSLQADPNVQKSLTYLR